MTQTEPLQKKTPGAVVVFSICAFILGILTGILGMIQMGDLALAFLGALLVGLCSACFEFFLQFCFQPGNIFKGWLPWIERNFRDNLKNPFAILYKPLGGCAYCQNIWISFAGFAILHGVHLGSWEIFPGLVELSWWWIIPASFFAHLFLSILDKLFWQ